ncbi:hypothetical protein K490DRAFT_68983 [Saccharata proteae CBS 121410]|uniref:Uncharacterized protein n=1 Tax=Saccharata proteae CBS 121410 TaxID=1314787 RepID=A0A9P4HQM8_9PEZI|nr:hypothetical protein K490DRAFT_68983 [Saccharata proteae CBS 121410]
MSSFLKSYKPVWVVAGALGLMYAVPKLSGDTSSVFETQASQAIGDRYSAGGGSTTHLPATATKRGDPNNVVPRHNNPKGIDTEHFKENVSSQRPGEPGPFDKSWNKTHYGGNEKGK